MKKPDVKPAQRSPTLALECSGIAGAERLQACCEALLMQLCSVLATRLKNAATQGGDCSRPYAVRVSLEWVDINNASEPEVEELHKSVTDQVTEFLHEFRPRYRRTIADKVVAINRQKVH